MNTIEKIRAEIERLKSNMDDRDPLALNQKAGYLFALADVLSFLDTLEEERPEPYNPVYDEAYLNEKIAKATKSWKGVDVDAMLAECRGYEEKSEKTTNLDLEKEIASFITQFGWGNTKHLAEKELINCTARHFAEWGYLRAAEKYNEIEYNRQRASGSSEKPNNHEGLDEAAEEYYKKAKKHLFDNSPIGDCRHAFKAGAKWQAEQLLKSSPLPEDTVLFNKGVEEGKRLMMEEAVEGFIFQSADYYPKQLIAGYDGELGMGDKVRIIIVKEDWK